MTSPIRINYLYFGVLFLIFSLVHCTHIQLIEYGGWKLKTLFLFYAIGQSLLEVGFLVLLSGWIGAWKKKYQWIFVVCTLVLLLLHLIDFPLVRMMDLSIWQACKLILQETWNNFIEMLHATHIRMFTWIGLGIGCLLFLILGLLGYAVSERYSISLSMRACVCTLAIFPLTMLLCDCVLSPYFPVSYWRTYERTLPWKRTFASVKESKISLQSHLQPMLNEKEMLESISQVVSPFSMQLVVEKTAEYQKQPDIFLFIIESLRRDYLTNEVAPHLTDLERVSTSAVENIASANATQLSWFSIFYGKFPFYFATLKERKWQSGSPALYLLKKMGYRIEVFSAARLSYYKMDELIFGKNLQLADAIHSYPHDDFTPAYESDRRTMEHLIARATEKGNQRGRCYIIFLESTHFGYSWPTEKCVFWPCDDQINYLDLLVSKRTLPSVQNRYRNAIHYLDDLFGDFIQALKKTKKWEDAVIAVTSDHGEEFYEGGHLFHASSLNSAQTRIPLFFKLGKRPKESASILGSHIDLFPTLFHHLLQQEEPFQQFFDGQSILTAKKWPYTLTGRYNGCCNPYEFCMETPRQKLIAQFTQPQRLFETQEIRIMELRDTKDRQIESSSHAIEKEFLSGINELFKHP